MEKDSCKGKTAPRVLRPARGLQPEEALQRWSDPIVFGEMMQYVDSSRRVVSTPEGFARNRNYTTRRGILEAAFIEKLLSGIVLASAILEGDDSRRIIKPSLWDSLEIGYDLDWIAGAGRVYEAAEFFSPTCIPLNIMDVPEWVRHIAAVSGTPSANLRHDGKYRHVTSNGFEFRLGDQQGKVVQFLERKAHEGNPWQHIKAIQDGTGIGRMHDLFGKNEHWTLLLKSDGRGEYRLRNEGEVEPSGDRT